MKFLTYTSTRVALLSLLFLALAAHDGVQADPTDDFSFAIHQSPVTDAFRLMPEEKVARILGDHLTLFPQAQVPALARHLVRLCRKHRFDPAMILSLIQVESAFRPNAVSPAGAVGLMQLMPATAQVVARRFAIRYPGERALRDPFLNLELGVAYLSHLRDKYQELSPYFHLAAYNIGPARLDELRARKSFKPVQTRKYYEKIRGGVPRLRNYGKSGV
jgi:hypothetical protein